MKTIKIFIILAALISSISGAHPSELQTDTTSPAYKSWKYYRNASNEFNKGNYEQALSNAQRSLMFKPNKKSRKLIQKIRELGYSNVKTGVALINFDPVLAKQYLIRSKALIEPTDKRTMTKIEEALRSLEADQ